MTELAFVVYGRPQPAGSKKPWAVRKAGVPTGQIAVSDANPKAKVWKQEVASAAVKAISGTAMYRHCGPLEVELRFVLARPKSHMGTGKNADRLKRSAPAFPTSRPDALKLARGVEDAMTGVVYGDDAQTVRLVAEKVYGWPERCEVRVRPLLASVGAVDMEAAA